MKNCSTWGMILKESKDLDAFYKQRLRQLIRKRYPNMNSNQNLHKICKERTISVDILKGRWRLLHHVLCLPDETPAVKAIRFYFERLEKAFRGRPRETILTTIYKDISRTKSMKKDFPIPTVGNSEVAKEEGL